MNKWKVPGPRILNRYQLLSLGIFYMDGTQSIFMPLPIIESVCVLGGRCLLIYVDIIRCKLSGEMQVPR